MKRKEFVKSFSAILGLGMFNQSCTDETASNISPEEEVAEDTTEENEYEALRAKLKGAPRLYENKKLYFDLASTDHQELKSIGKFYNDLDNYVMILRKDQESYLAFDNCCPHLGSVTKWSFANNKFTCSNHNNSFGIGTNMIVPCSSGVTSGNLKQYTVEKIEDILIVNFD